VGKDVVVGDIPQSSFNFEELFSDPAEQRLKLDLGSVAGRQLGRPVGMLANVLLHPFLRTASESACAWLNRASVADLTRDRLDRRTSGGRKADLAVGTMYAPLDARSVERVFISILDAMRGCMPEHVIGQETPLAEQTDDDLQLPVNGGTELG
jgi:hypothetical protein